MTKKLEYNFNNKKMKIITSVIISNNGKEYNVKALWDTGATYSCIKTNIAKELGLVVFSTLEMETAGGESMANIYVANVCLENKIDMGEMIIFSAKIVSKEFDMLIGMDIISNGDFKIINSNGDTKFSFEI